ncbi:MAG: CHAP domain-containing protein [Alphaproteobacteria bacterium]|nr:CHAP domain-containing protein [Alphaproteobacteria bacterium]
MVRIRSQWIIFAFIMLLTACSGGSTFNSPHASGHYTNTPMQCVPYARKVSGIEIYGDAHTWWHQASPRYGRGTMPAPGAVLVLAKTRRLQHGHLAVVKRIISNRQIEVTHSNWGHNRATRSMIYDAMRVEDISPMNNWSQLRFWNYHSSAFGSPYAAYGFIYR